MDDNIILRLMCTITAMICITMIEITALLHGIDSFLTGITVAVIAGLGGYQLKGFIVKIKSEDSNIERKYKEW